MSDLKFGVLHDIMPNIRFVADIFKSSIYRKFSACVGYKPKYDKKEQYANYTDLFDVVREVAIQYDELTAMRRNRLTED
jgi:hypothetical protein